MRVNIKIRKIRKQQKIRQEDIAKTIGVAVDTYRRWEQGKYQPRVSDLKNIAAALNISVSELLEENERGALADAGAN